ncbi:GspMb/PilO family protein [Pseudomonas sp.]|uniref:GspMb/PilO family protein n=1 Tax=Pseudomonas sp. TaxID=306 RepID=UPI00299DFEFE|nr:GspMb/PilO family protein [Pseudomonas sp.]MDX1368511.1 GspMb/PilO family protein [Pseudomonas sp.]
MRVPRLILHEQALRLGWPGLCGASLILLALAYAGLGLLPGRQTVLELAERSARGQERLARVDSGTLAQPMAPGRQLDAFRQTLPAQLEATTAIDRIYALASRERIALDSGEYSLGIDPKTRLARYQILLPVRGSYPQQRRFLHALLAEMPALVLEDLELKRKQIAETELEGRLRMTLYLSRQ